MKDDLPDTEKDQLKLQVAARAKLNDPTRPPSFVIQFCAPNRDANGSPQPPFLCDAKLARVGNREIRREEGETYEAFERRVQNELPASGLPVSAIIWPAEPDNCIIT
jgi:hypothetical protein